MEYFIILEIPNSSSKWYFGILKVELIKREQSSLSKNWILILILQIQFMIYSSLINRFWKLGKVLFQQDIKQVYFGLWNMMVRYFHYAFHQIQRKSNFSIIYRILATGSMDATCRLWSTIKGTLLFQIDTPSAISKIHFADNASFYCTCMNRMFYFDYNIKANENTRKEMM